MKRRKLIADVIRPGRAVPAIVGHVLAVPPPMSQRVISWCLRSSISGRQAKKWSRAGAWAVAIKSHAPGLFPERPRSKATGLERPAKQGFLRQILGPRRHNSRRQKKPGPSWVSRGCHPIRQYGAGLRDERRRPVYGDRRTLRFDSRAAPQRAQLLAQKLPRSQGGPPAAKRAGARRFPYPSRDKDTSPLRKRMKTRPPIRRHSLFLACSSKSCISRQETLGLSTKRTIREPMRDFNQ